MTPEELQMFRRAYAIACRWAGQVRKNPLAYWDWEKDEIIHSPTERSLYEEFRKLAKWTASTNALRDNEGTGVHEVEQAINSEEDR